MKRLYVAISGHGFGHLAQTAPVLEALHRRRPDVGFVVRSALPRDVLEKRLDLPFEYLDEASDCNLVMHDAIRVDVPASLNAYRAFHHGWERTVDAEARRLDDLHIDAVFSNVGYLPLAAAQRAGRPAVAMCSLNWADIFRHYLGAQADVAAILDAMDEAYAYARAFLCPMPSMSMPDFDNAVAIPPVAQPGRPRRRELAGRLGLDEGERLVLIGMGGIPYRLPLESWPRIEGVAFLAPDLRVHAPGCHSLSATGMSFRDALASADALITKPGYGSYVEAATAGVPVLAIPRPDWPEAPFLDDWLAAHARCCRLPEARLIAGDLAEPLATLWAESPKVPPVADGADAAARLLETYCLD